MVRTRRVHTCSCCRGSCSVIPSPQRCSSAAQPHATGAQTSTPGKPGCRKAARMSMQVHAALLTQWPCQLHCMLYLSRVVVLVPEIGLALCTLQACC